MRRACTAALLSIAASVAVAEDAPSIATLRAAGGPAIEVLGPKGETLGRAMAPGWALAQAEGVPQLSRISATQVLLVWNGPGGAAVSILEVSGGALREVWSDAFEAGWAIQPASDFNGDGKPDFLLVRSKGEGDDRSYEGAIAVWDREKGIDVVTDPVVLVPRCRGAFFTSGDVDGDGRADVVFHSFDYGGPFETNLFMLKGHGDGTVDATEKKVPLLKSPHAASNPVLADFDGDGDLDVFLPPDDDVEDEGQCFVAFNKGDGTMEGLKESVDLSPANEGDSGDTFFATAFLADSDGDGKADLVARCDHIPDRTWEVRLYRGLGGGQFEEKGTVLASGRYESAPMTSFAWVGWPGKDAQIPEAAPDAKAMDGWWASLGSAKPREAARAMGAFLRAGAAAASWLAKKAPAKAELDEDRIRNLIRDLDDDDIRVRDKASAALKDMADVAVKILEDARANATSPEVRARLRDILDAPPAEGLEDLKPEDRPQLRLLALLEALDTPESRDAAERFAQPGVPLPVRHAAAEVLKRRK